MKELSEDSKFQISLKTLGGIVVLIVTLVGMWFTLQADIEEAKMLPEMPISEKEFELKDKLIRGSILSTQEDVKEIKEDMKYLRDKIDKMD
jgi:hypothetical protein|tara:strand:+ start:193 stop:465 length:273 start_codon:yes stop_codon:yes gene_type:complete